MLPDLWRMVDRGMRPRRDVVIAEDDPPEVRGLLAGIDHHLEADAWFHADAVFTEGLAATTERLRRETFDARKVVLMAHVAWELCLDGALLRREGTEELMSSFRRDVEEIATEHLAAVARRHRPDVPPPDLRRLLGDLAESDWIPGYRHGRGVARRLAGVRRRVRLEPLSDRDHDRLAEAFEERLAAADAALPRLLTPAS